MTNTYIQAAFHSACDEAKAPESHYVSLYSSQQRYGGPEEGGWWHSVNCCEASQEYQTREQAEAAREQCKAVAAKLEEASKRSYGDEMLRSMDWLDARGMEASDLPEPDGPVTYDIRIESTPGQSDNSRAPMPHYE